jgi:hypothetical protein
MARDLTAAWEFLTAATRARQRLATARPLIWDKARLPTAEHTAIVRTAPAGAGETDRIAVRVSLETLLKDGRRVISCLELAASPQRWRARPFIAFGDAAEGSLWEGQAVEGDDYAGFADAVDSEAYALVEATTSLDFAAIERG